MILLTQRFIYVLKLVFPFSSYKYPEVEMLDHVVVLFLIFWGTSKLFFIVATKFAFLPIMHKGSLSSSLCWFGDLWFVVKPYFLSPDLQLSFSSMTPLQHDASPLFNSLPWNCWKFPIQNTIFKSIPLKSQHSKEVSPLQIYP